MPLHCAEYLRCFSVFYPLADMWYGCSLSWFLQQNYEFDPGKVIAFADCWVCWGIKSFWSYSLSSLMIVCKSWENKGMWEWTLVSSEACTACSRDNVLMSVLGCTALTACVMSRIQKDCSLSLNNQIHEFVCSVYLQITMRSCADGPRLARVMQVGFVTWYAIHESLKTDLCTGSAFLTASIDSAEHIIIVYTAVLQSNAMNSAKWCYSLRSHGKL